MTNKEKITIRKDWNVAGVQARRVNIIGATYREALTYLTQLKIRGCKDTAIKPLLIKEIIYAN